MWLIERRHAHSESARAFEARRENVAVGQKNTKLNTPFDKTILDSSDNCVTSDFGDT
jgi:hypothetical protein